MKRPVHYRPEHQMYYVTLMSLGNTTYVAKKDVESYKDKDSPWEPVTLALETDRWEAILSRKYVYIEDVEIDDDWLAHYLLVVGSE